MIISNELVGVDITLNCSTCFGYNTMGFETSAVTQDCDDMDDYFGIMTHRPIPVLQYGDTFTWAKYGYMVLHPNTIRELIPGQDTSYCNALMSFLQTDVKGFVSFQPFESLHDDIDTYINNIVHGEMTATQQINFLIEISVSPPKKVMRSFPFWRVNKRSYHCSILGIFESYSSEIDMA
jgi:hypothetical protein